MKISRLKPLLRALIADKTSLKRNLLIFMLCCAAKVWAFIGITMKNMAAKAAPTVFGLRVNPF